MKVLLLNGGDLESISNKGYNGGGWRDSFCKALKQYGGEEIEIEVACPWSENIQETIDGMVYYGIKRMRRIFWQYKAKQQEEYNRIKEVIELSNPDIIHVFGTEISYGMACTLTNIPVVIHIQGLLTAIHEVWLPQGLSWFRYRMNDWKFAFIEYTYLSRFVQREKKILSSCKYVMGRTHWDQTIAMFEAPQAEYFYCSEMIRPVIYNARQTWTPQFHSKRIIVSIISGAVYKGGDVILRTARRLKEFWGDKFEWRVYGIENLYFMSSLTGVDAKSVNVKVLGKVSAEQLVSIVTSADVFVHPSYIENSPNTVCEAQLLGCPIIATNVGGVSTLIRDGEDGLLVAGGDVYLMASKIRLLLENTDLALKFSKNGRMIALNRHNPEKIVKNVMSVFKYCMMKR